MGPWPALIVLVFPVAIVFALLGRHYPSAGGVAHFVEQAFGPRLARVTGWLFLSVIPVGLPAALHIASGFTPGAVRLARLAAAHGRDGDPRRHLVAGPARRQLER